MNNIVLIIWIKWVAEIKTVYGIAQPMDSSLINYVLIHPKRPQKDY